MIGHDEIFMLYWNFVNFFNLTKLIPCHVVFNHPPLYVSTESQLLMITNACVYCNMSMMKFTENNSLCMLSSFPTIKAPLQLKNDNIIIC